MMSDDGSNHFGAIDETTKRLVGRCSKVSWLRETDPASPTSPTKIKQRLLSVSLPSAMESSLSVMEVAAQKSKPGVKTPSRAEEKRKEEMEEEIAKAESHGIGIGEKIAVGSDDVDNSLISKVLEVGKSPFEVEGEA